MPLSDLTYGTPRSWQASAQAVPAVLSPDQRDGDHGVRWPGSNGQVVMVSSVSTRPVAGRKPMRSCTQLAAAVVLLFVTASCGSTAPSPALISTSSGSAPSVRGVPSAADIAGDPAARPSIAPGVRPSKVLVVIEENHTAAAALQGMPFLASLAAAYGQATNYRAVAHPSLPNYLAVAGGSTFGITDDQPPDRHPITGDSVFDGALATGTTAKTYAEAMPGPCTLTSTGTYAVKHNPWAYFSDTAPRANCQLLDLPAGTTTVGALHDDINGGTLPTVGLLVPDMCNDGHDCPLTTADNWLQQWIPAVMNGSDYQAGRLAVVVTFDEDDRSGPNTVLTTVIAPTVRKQTATTELTHYSSTGYLAELAGVAPPNQAAAAPAFREAFGI